MTTVDFQKIVGTIPRAEFGCGITFTAGNFHTFDPNRLVLYPPKTSAVEGRGNFTIADARYIVDTPAGPRGYEVCLKHTPQKISNIAPKKNFTPGSTEPPREWIFTFPMTSRATINAPTKDEQLAIKFFEAYSRRRFELISNPETVRYMSEVLVNVGAKLELASINAQKSGNTAATFDPLIKPLHEVRNVVDKNAKTAPGAKPVMMKDPNGQRTYFLRIKAKPKARNAVKTAAYVPVPQCVVRDGTKTIENPITKKAEHPIIPPREYVNFNPPSSGDAAATEEDMVHDAEDNADGDEGYITAECTPIEKIEGEYFGHHGDDKKWVMSTRKFVTAMLLKITNSDSMSYTGDADLDAAEEPGTFQFIAGGSNFASSGPMTPAADPATSDTATAMATSDPAATPATATEPATPATPDPAPATAATPATPAATPSPAQPSSAASTDAAAQPKAAAGHPVYKVAGSAKRGAPLSIDDLAAAGSKKKVAGAPAQQFSLQKPN